MAETPVASLLSTLSDRAAKLNAESDSLNSILATVERRLVEANVGVETWVKQALSSTDHVGDLFQPTTWTALHLGFAKVEGKWCIATKSTRYVSGFFEGDTNCPFTNQYADGDPSPVSKASRDVRVLALEQLPLLIQAVTESAESCLDSIERAKSLV